MDGHVFLLLVERQSLGEWPGCDLAGSIFTNRLRDGQDMPFVKALLEGRLPMSRRAKDHSLLTNHCIRFL